MEDIRNIIDEARGKINELNGNIYFYNKNNNSITDVRYDDVWFNLTVHIIHTLTPICRRTITLEDSYD